MEIIYIAFCAILGVTFIALLVILHFEFILFDNAGIVYGGELASKYRRAYDAHAIILPTGNSTTKNYWENMIGMLYPYVITRIHDNGFAGIVEYSYNKLGLDLPEEDISRIHDTAKNSAEELSRDIAKRLHVDKNDFWKLQQDYSNGIWHVVENKKNVI